MNTERVAGLLAVLAAIVAIVVPSGRALAQEGSLMATSLRCEYLTDPVGLDSAHPRLSWVVAGSQGPALRGRVQTAYRVLVADSTEALAADRGSLWDSGRVSSDQSIQVEYAGKPLRSRTRAYWKVMVWDNEGRASAWSRPAQWSMGLLGPEDWGAEWIGDPTEPPPVVKANNGYHSHLVGTGDESRWVAIELSGAARIDSVRLFPVHPYDWNGDNAPGLMFPVRFKIEVADTADFKNARTVVDKTGADVPNPKDEPHTYSFQPVNASFVRLTATKLAMRDPGNFALALAEMQVLSAGKAVSQGAPVTAQDSLETGPWAMVHLTDGDLTSHNTGGLDPIPPAMLRKTFGAGETGAKVIRATAYATALGMYELRLNGEKVDPTRVFAPEWTDYTQKVQYQTYDVTGLVKAGAENAIGVILGDGWYAGRIGLSFIVPNGPSRGIYGRKTAFMLRLEVEFEDGKTVTVVSDGSWRCTSDGPIRVSDLLDGEIYDARREIAGWDTPAFTESASQGWTGVKVHDGVKTRLVSQPNEPIRITRDLTPASVSEPSPGVFVFDMGQNMVGWCRLNLPEGLLPEDSTLTLRHAEVLKNDGMLFTDNLRSAQATDRYTSAGAGAAYEPRFTYHGFRYVEVTGLKSEPPTDLLTGRVVNSAPPEVGRLETSSPLINKLWQNVLWTQRGNMYSVPTDCPQRDERLGWMGDILAFAPAASFNMDMAAFFTKWIPDVREAQTSDGRFSDFSPHPFGKEVRFSGVPAWGDAGVVVPWVAYQYYGDTRLLAEHYDAARRWVEYIHSKNPDLLWKNERHNDYGDWLTADTFRIAGFPKKGAEMPKEAFATAFFAHSTDLLARMATVLGKKEDAARYAALFDEIKAAFNKAYVKPDGTIEGDTQGGYAIALEFGLLPESLRAAAAQKMVEASKPYNGQISTGFHSTRCLMLQLNQNGLIDEAYRLVTNRKMPSWGYLIDHGATTIWERWDGHVEGAGFQDSDMNSFSHYAFGSVSEWMYRTILGINLDEDSPAFKKFSIRPRPGGGLTWARGSYGSMRGTIESAWRIEGETITLSVTIPANTTATVYVPTDDSAAVTEGGNPAKDAPGLRFLRAENGAAVYEAGSGTYAFTAPYKGGS